MLFVDEFLGMAFLAIWIYGLVDVITTDGALARNLPKGTWIFIVLFGFVIGAGAWIFFGRPAKAGYLPGDTTYRKPVRRPMAPDDNPDFLRNLNGDPARSPAATPTDAAGRDLKAWEADLARREQAWADELQRREDDLKRRQAGED
jgi:hypothetical protein